MHYAAQVGAGIVILALLEVPTCAPDLHSLDANGRTPLHVIAKAPIKTITTAVEAMIAAGASVSAEDSNGFTPLHAAAKAGSTAMTKMLVQAGAVTEAQNHAGKTALDIARAKQHREVVEFLGGQFKKKKWYQVPGAIMSS